MFENNLDYNIKDVGPIGILYGGFSNERSVSLESGICLLNACKRMGLDVKGYDIASPNDLFKLASEGLAGCLLALHGGDGEDGHVQSVLDLMDIPYVGSGVLASANCMNKVSARLICKAIGVPVMPWIAFKGSEPPHKIDFDFPVCLKPVSGGSSIGVSKVESMEAWLELRSSLEDIEWMIEPWFYGVDQFVGVLGDQVLPILEISLPSGQFFDYSNKYSSNSGSKYKVVTNEKLANWTYEAFTALRCKDYARADFITIGERSWFLEMNTLPGLSPVCLMPRQVKALGLTYEDFVKILLSSIVQESLCV